MGVVEWMKRRMNMWIDEQLGAEYQACLRSLAIPHNEYGYDPFGFSRNHLRYGFLFARWLHRSYFRTETFGAENVPGRGRVLLIANHSGQIPFDGMAASAAAMLECHPPRIPRLMTEKFVPTLPFASYLLARWGQITGTSDNCRRLLNNDECIMDFPEGVAGLSKPFSKRYQLQPFRLGFMRRALETNTPIVPVAIIGAEEQAPAINLQPVARMLNLPAFPIVPYPPLLPVIPLPVKYRIYFGDPMTFHGGPDDDDTVLAHKVQGVKNAIHSLIYIGLKERRGVFT